MKARVWVRYGLAVGATVVAVLFRATLDPVLDERGPLIIQMAGVVLASMIGGIGPGLLAAILGALSGAYFFMAPRQSLYVADPDVLANLLLYFGLAVLISVFGELYTRNRRRLVQRGEELRRAHDTFFNMIRNAPFGVYVIDTDFRVWQVSRGAQKVFATVQPVLGRDFAEVLRTVWPEPFASEAIARFRHTLETGAPYHSADTTEQRGDIHEVESYDWLIERITLPDGQFGVACYFYETTVLKRAEAILRSNQEHLERAIAERTGELKRSNEQLRRSETLAVLGALSRGISHDLANLLLPLEAHVDRIRGETISPEVRESIEAIGTTARYLRDLSRRLRDYMNVAADPAKADGNVGEEIRLDRFCSEIKSFLTSVLPPHVVLECKMPPGLPLINVNRAALAQAVYNLVQNAGQVIQEHRVGGRIELRAERTNGQIRLIVEDDGPGMPPEVRKRALEPFFTTGPRMSGGGSGIGLSLVKGFVESCGGTLEVHSPPAPNKPRGTAFVLTLPPLCGQEDGKEAGTQTEPMGGG